MGYVSGCGHPEMRVLSQQSGFLQLLEPLGPHGITKEFVDGHTQA
jgi:hypothetical protein